MHPFHQYVSQHLVEMLRKRRVVVWYDPRSEFNPYIRELCGGAEPDSCRVDKVKIAALEAGLCVYQGSFFEVKFAVEPFVAVAEPGPLLIYIPGKERDRRQSLLLELEKAGECYEPQLKRLARNVLRQQYTDGVIDGLLTSDAVSYEDVAAFAGSEAGGPKSMLKVIFDKAPDGASLVATWLATPASDEAISKKSAREELYSLVGSRLGLDLTEDTLLAEARTKALRYVLIGEFRDDLTGEPPTAVGMIPAPRDGEQLKFLREVAGALRQRHLEEYPSLADGVERDFGLATLTLAAEALGKVDTFRFEEQALLKHCGALTCQKRFGDAVRTIEQHHRSFWADREVRRQQQWQACRLMADLGRLTEEIRAQLPNKGAVPGKWIDAYAAEDGWYRVDLAQRNLESLVATMSGEPDSEEALGYVRREYERLLQDMAVGLTESLQFAKWAMPGVLHQTQVYADLVGRQAGPIAYILVDSMRYEMGVELRDRLKEAENLVLRPAVAEFPTITAVGMAALLPGASASFGVVADDGKLAGCVDGVAMSDLAARLKFLTSHVPGAVELELGKVLQLTKKQLESKIRGAPLIVVRSQDIDSLGEGATTHLARQVMDTAIGNVARAVSKLAAQGVEQFVVAADHGHLFAWEKDESMRIESPGGDTVALHRRCWVGRGGTTPPGTVRVSGAELGYGTDLDFVFPTGIGVFKAGGDLAYHHGGISLQELLIPVLALRMPMREKAQEADFEVVLSGVPESVSNRTFGVVLELANTLFGNKPAVVRPILLSGNVQVGEAGMVIDAGFDMLTHCVKLELGKKASVAMVLKREDCEKVRVVVQDPETDAVLAESNPIPVRLGI